MNIRHIVHQLKCCIRNLFKFVIHFLVVIENPLDGRVNNTSYTQRFSATHITVDEYYITRFVSIDIYVSHSNYN